MMVTTKAILMAAAADTVHGTTLTAAVAHMETADADRVAVPVADVVDAA